MNSHRRKRSSCGDKSETSAKHFVPQWAFRKFNALLDTHESDFSALPELPQEVRPELDAIKLAVSALSVGHLQPPGIEYVVREERYFAKPREAEIERNSDGA